MNFELTDQERMAIVRQYHSWVVDSLLEAVAFPAAYLSSVLGLLILLEKLCLI